MHSYPQVDEYRRIAPLYGALLEPLLAGVKRDICRIVKKLDHDSVLDLCCGVGRQCAMLHAMGVEATGVDASPAMIRQARLSSPTGVRYHEEDASHLHFQPYSFDCVIISFALHEKNQQKRHDILREASRVTKRPGNLIILDYILPRGLSSRLPCLAIHAIERAAGASHYSNFRHFMQKGALEALLQDNGLDFHLLESRYAKTVGLALVSLVP